MRTQYCPSWLQNYFFQWTSWVLYCQSVLTITIIFFFGKQIEAYKSFLWGHIYPRIWLLLTSAYYVRYFPIAHCGFFRFQPFWRSTRIALIVTKKSPTTYLREHSWTDLVVISLTICPMILCPVSIKLYIVWTNLPCVTQIITTITRRIHLNLRWFSIIEAYIFLCRTVNSVALFFRLNLLKCYPFQTKCQVESKSHKLFLQPNTRSIFTVVIFIGFFQLISTGTAKI